MRPRIREARAADAAGIARVHVESWRSTYRGLLPGRYLDGMSVRGLAERWRRRISTVDSEQRIVVAALGGEVLGFGQAGACEEHSLAGFAGEVQMLYVHPSYLRRGLGAALFGRALEMLAERPYFWLVVWVVEDNRQARVFYERMGLKPDGGRRTDRFLGCPVHVVRYAMPLNPVVDYDRLIEQLAGEPAD